MSTKKQRILKNWRKVSENDSGFDSFGEETPVSEMQDVDPTVNCTLEENIALLETEVNAYFDRIIESFEERRTELLKNVADVGKITQRTEEVDKTGQCLGFTGQQEVFGMIDTLGKLHDKKACASLSTATGIGLRYGICNETNSFVLQTRNKYGDLSWSEHDQVTVFIRSAGKMHKCIVQNKCNGIYDVFYELPDPGCFEMFVKVNGENTSESPFKCCLFEKQDLKFRVEDSAPELLIQNNEKTALLEKSEYRHCTRLYSHVGAIARAWKVRVTTPCPKIKLKIGYSYDSPHIPHLQEEFVCKFDLNELKIVKTQPVSAMNYQPTRKRNQHRKQSTFQCTSLTFVVIEDVNENRIHVALENTNTEKTTSFNGDSHKLIPFIGVKHFCKNVACPRPTLVFV